MARWLVGGIASLLLMGIVVLWGDYLNRPTRSLEVSKAANEPMEEVITRKRERHVTLSYKPFPADLHAEPLREPEFPSIVNSQTTEQSETESPLSMPPVTSGPVEALKRAYARESTDAYARKTEAEIRSVIGAKVIPPEHLRSVNCRNTVCKIGMDWSEGDSLSHIGVAMMVGTQQADIVAFETANVPDTDGTLPLDLYVVRAGYTLEDIK